MLHSSACILRTSHPRRLTSSRFRFSLAEEVTREEERIRDHCRGSVYVLLGRLEEKGFVRVLKAKPEPGYDGPPRPQYQLTAEGTRVMAAAEAIGMSFSAGRA